jgi:hypothetical protein
MTSEFPHKWTEENFEVAKRILARHGLIVSAVGEIAEAVGFPVTVKSLQGAFSRAGHGAPSQFLNQRAPKRDAPPSPRQADEADKDQSLRALFEAVKRGPVSFVELCDHLDMSPGKARVLIDRAKADGMKLRIENDHIGIDNRDGDDRLQPSGVSPVAGKRSSVAIISDVHAGSKFFLRAQLREFVNYAYERGIRHVLCVGDMLDGDYRHAKFEMSHMGLDEQTLDLFETLPELKDLRYHAITGNHEQTFADKSGVDVGRYIESYFREHGRASIRFYGQRSAFLKIYGATVHLWHPRSGPSYAKSYSLQKKAEGYAAIKPQILLAGHWHFHGYVFERGIHAMACPTFQGEGSDFGNSLRSSPAIGGLILSWDLTEQGTIRNFVHEYRSYYQRERVFNAHNEMGGIEVERPHRKSGWAK